MAIQGLRDTSNFVTNQRPENWREALLLLYPNSAQAAKAPLTALTTAMKTRVVDDPVYHWFEKSLDDRRLELHATNGNLDAPAAGTIQTLTLASGSNAKTFVENDVLLVMQTQERLRVVSDPTSDTQIQVVRGFASTTPTAVDADGANINPWLLNIGSSFEEGSLAPSGVSYDPTEQYNNLQIFRKAMEITNTATKTRLRTGDQVKEARRECLEYAGIDMERAFWFGKRATTTKNGKPLRTTNGIYNQMDSNNIYSFTNGQMDLSTIEQKLEEVFRYGSSEKVGFAGNKAIMAFGQAVRKNSSYQIEGGVTEHNMKVTRITTPFGELVLKAHPLFTQSSGGTNGGGTSYYDMNTWIWILDMDNIGYVHLTDRDLKYEGDLEAVGQDAMKAGYIAECGIELHHASTHFLWKQCAEGIIDA